MKKFLVHIIVLTHHNCWSYGQTYLDFKVQYKPSTTYSEILKQTSVMELTFSGSEAFLKQLGEKGTQNPTIKKIQSVSETVTNTGKLIDGTYFPIVIKLTKSTGNDDEDDFTDGASIYGQGYIGKAPIFDSISSGGLIDDDKKAFLDGLTSLLALSSIPEKRLKIGESFSQETPLFFSMQGVNLEVLITTNYKLVSILNKVASFDIDQTYILKSPSSAYKPHATGKGKGQLLYDMENSFYSNYQIDSDIQLNIQLENLTRAAKTNNRFTQSTTIRPNGL